MCNYHALSGKNCPWHPFYPDQVLKLWSNTTFKKHPQFYTRYFNQFHTVKDLYYYFARGIFFLKHCFVVKFCPLWMHLPDMVTDLKGSHPTSLTWKGCVYTRLSNKTPFNPLTPKTQLECPILIAMIIRQVYNLSKLVTQTFF